MASPRKKFALTPWVSALEGRQLLTATAATLPGPVQGFVNQLQAAEHQFMTAASHTHNAQEKKFDTAMANLIQNEINAIDQLFGVGTSTGGTTTGGGTGGTTTGGSTGTPLPGRGA